MPYYRGDYYRGDNYYRGDFLGLGKAFKSVTGFVGGLGIPGVSQIARGANALASGKNVVRAVMGSNLPMVLPPSPTGIGLGGQTAPFVGLRIGGDQGIQVGYQGAGGGAGGQIMGTTATGRRRRLCAKNIGGQAILVPCPRRMNVTNVRALRRAGRRVKGFLKLAHRFGALPVNRGKGGKLFKAKRHARK